MTYASEFETFNHSKWSYVKNVIVRSLKENMRSHITLNHQSQTYHVLCGQFTDQHNACFTEVIAAPRFLQPKSF